MAEADLYDRLADVVCHHISRSFLRQPTVRPSLILHDLMSKSYMEDLTMIIADVGLLQSVVQRLHVDGSTLSCPTQHMGYRSFTTRYAISFASRDKVRVRY